MNQRGILASYLGLMTLVATTLGGYVACGAQRYRVSIHGNDPESAGRRPSTSPAAQSTTQSGASEQGAASQLAGVHSSKGWGTGLPIVFKVSKEVPVQVSAYLQDAMKTWETAIGKTLFRYEGVEEKTGAEFKDLYDPLNDKVNGHYFDFNWTKSTGKSSTVIATTIWENDKRDPALIAKADIRYNNQFYVFGNALKDSSIGDRIIVDMQSLALHELGHLLGLTHIAESEDRYSTMNPSLFIGEGMITRRLSEGDIKRIRSVYGVGDDAAVETLEKADNFPTNSL